MSSTESVADSNVKKHNPPEPTNANQPTLGEQQPGAPFSLMTFTYPVLLLVAAIIGTMVYWLMQPAG